MQYRKKPVVIDAFKYEGDLKNSGGTGRRKAFMVPWKVSGIAGNCGRGVFCKRMG